MPDIRHPISDIRYEPVIGLEIHVELKTKSKMFCQCAADWFGKPPNSHVCPVCLGMPGGLPVPNQKAIDWVILIGKALGCRVNQHTKFDRKHYSYPDLPKGYQISQFDHPFCVDGQLTVNGKTFRIHRVHMEEDTGKLLHEGKDTLVDFNRSGVPLVEIVTEPDFHNSDDVKAFLEELQVIIRYLDVSDADMEKGSMRLEPNISVRKMSDVGSQISELPNYKVEVKNINSFRFVKQAIEYEVERHIELLEKGETPAQETRGFNEKKVETYAQRSKEAAQEYRYFPEPDIPPFHLSEEYVNSIKVPLLAQDKVAEYMSLGIREKDAFTLTRDKKVMAFFDTCLVLVAEEKAVAELPQKLANALINKQVSNELPPAEFVAAVLEKNKPKETDTDQLSSVIKAVLSAHGKVAADYKAGKTNAIMFLVGQVMREMKGKADAALVKSELEKALAA